MNSYVRGSKQDKNLAKEHSLVKKINQTQRNGRVMDVKHNIDRLNTSKPAIDALELAYSFIRPLFPSTSHDPFDVENLNIGAGNYARR
jgi:hypothetical protein